MCKAIGYTNLFDFYSVIKTIGKGQYGIISLAKHKKTGREVAIKTVAKKNMSPLSIF